MRTLMFVLAAAIVIAMTPVTGFAETASQNNPASVEAAAAAAAKDSSATVKGNSAAASKDSSATVKGNSAAAAKDSSATVKGNSAAASKDSSATVKGNSAAAAKDSSAAAKDSSAATAKDSSKSAASATAKDVPEHGTLTVAGKTLITDGRSYTENYTGEFRGGFWSYDSGSNSLYLFNYGRHLQDNLKILGGQISAENMGNFTLKLFGTDNMIRTDGTAGFSFTGTDLTIGGSGDLEIGANNHTAMNIDLTEAISEVKINGGGDIFCVSKYSTGYKGTTAPNAAIYSSKTVYVDNGTTLEFEADSHAAGTFYGLVTKGDLRAEGSTIAGGTDGGTYGYGAMIGDSSTDSSTLQAAGDCSITLLADGAKTNRAIDTTVDAKVYMDPGLKASDQPFGHYISSGYGSVDYLKIAYPFPEFKTAPRDITCYKGTALKAVDVTLKTAASAPAAHFEWNNFDTMKRLSTSSVFKPSTSKVGITEYVVQVKYGQNGNERNYYFTVKVIPKKGYTFTKGALKYKVTKTGVKGGQVTVIKTKKKSYSKVTIPETVNLGGIKFSVTRIGANAFYKNTRLKTITIKTLKLKSVGRNAFKNINRYASIKCPHSKLEKYRRMMMNKGQAYTVWIR